MGHGLIMGQGNLIYSDDCTATSDDVLKGKTALFNGSDDNIRPGTLELTGNAVEDQVLAGKTFYAADPHVKRTGNIQSQPGWTPIPSTKRQVLECKGKYMTENVVIPAFAMPPADVIKEGATVSIYDQSVTGKWNGYTPATEYFWNAGNVGGVIGTGSLGFGQWGQVYSNDNNANGNTLITPKEINLRRYNRLFVEMAKSGWATNAGVSIYVVYSDGSRRLLKTFLTESNNYVRFDYAYDASLPGKLLLIFIKQGTGVIRWGVQNV